MKKLIQRSGLVLLGFALYPLLFVPLCVKLFPAFLEWWVYVYADYLRWVGIQ